MSHQLGMFVAPLDREAALWLVHRADGRFVALNRLAEVDAKRQGVEVETVLGQLRVELADKPHVLRALELLEAMRSAGCVTEHRPPARMHP